MRSLGMGQNDVPGLVSVAPAGILVNVAFVALVVLVGGGTLFVLGPWLRVPPERHALARWLIVFAVALVGTAVIGALATALLNRAGPSAGKLLVGILMWPLLFATSCTIAVRALQYVGTARALLASVLAGFTSAVSALVLMLVLAWRMRP
jgi:Na+-translocating ferredoxin:NAD+ oxidoreductase RnfA subunit